MKKTTPVFLLPHLLAESATTNPEGTAIVDASHRTTYRELLELSDRLAGWLVGNNVRPGDRVGLLMPKCTESIVSIFGIMKAGAAYVPIDSAAPASRAAGIVADCDVSVIITTPRHLPGLATAMGGEITDVTVIVLGDQGDLHTHQQTGKVLAWSEVIADHHEPFHTPGITERDLAYILYTSGSTGSPKGVMISHRAALSFINWACDAFDLVKSDVVSSHAPLHFDLSIFDIFATIKAAATIVLLKEGMSTFPIQLTQAIEANSITVWYSVPSALVLMLERGKFEESDLATLRTVIFAGEVFPTPHLKRLRESTSAKLFNLYGPTETNVCTFYRVDTVPEDPAETIPIGRAIDNYCVFAVDDEGNLAGTGQHGELYASGPGLMSGYWGDAARTDQRLVQNPLHQNFKDPVFRTGDIVYLDSEGRYRFVGRRDHQIKIRGYRVELGEVEAALSIFPLITESAVLPFSHSVDTRVLVGIVAVAPGCAVTADQLKAHCIRNLPRYMVPDDFIVKDVLPKTSTGKVNRQKLADELLARAEEME